MTLNERQTLSNTPDAIVSAPESRIARFRDPARADSASPRCYGARMERRRRVCLCVLAGFFAIAAPTPGVAKAKRHIVHHKLMRRRPTLAMHHPRATHDPVVHQRSPATTADLRPVIIIDPGHGGADPGAIGSGGTMEKNVTLATALHLRKTLMSTGRYQVLITRDDDHFVSLGDRARFGPANGASLIISLHADSSPDRNARGASVYVRSRESANGGLKRVVDGAGPAAIANALGVEPPHQANSSWLQYATIDSLNDDIQMTAAPARAAHLWVLASNGIPAVLVEMGFLSNHRDERLLCERRHQMLIAHRLRDAVDDYFHGLETSPDSHT
jgi:N-acetylmuramoyl-L-alanine amidase